MSKLYVAAVHEQAGGALLTDDSVSQPRKPFPPPSAAQGMVMPPGAAPPPGGAPPGGAPAQQPLAPGGQPLGQVDADLARWSLGNDPWAVMNLIAGDARTRTEVQDRLNNFLRMPTGQAMPQHIRNAIRAMGFQVLEQNDSTDGGAEADMAPGGQTPGGPAPAAGQGPPPAQQPVRETMGIVPNTSGMMARPSDEGHWLTMDHAGVKLMLFVSPGGTVLKGPAALMGANIKHLNAQAGERHMVFHPQGHIPPLADAQHTYSEHPDGAMPIRLRRQDSQLALVQALHDVAGQAQSAKKGRAQSQNAALAAQMQRQGAAARPPANDGGQGGNGFSSTLLPLSGAGDRGADNPMAGARTHASPEHDADNIAASGTGAQAGDASPHEMETPPTTGLVPKGAGASTGTPEDPARRLGSVTPSAAGGPDAAAQQPEAEEQMSPEDVDTVPSTHKMHAWLLDHVMAHQPEMEQRGGYSQPNEVARMLEESGTPPEQVLALAHAMHMWHPAGGPPQDKAGVLSQIINQALERAQGAGAIQPYDRTHYQNAMDQLQDFVGHHGRFPSHREFAAHMYGRGGAGDPGAMAGM